LAGLNVVNYNICN